MRFRRPTTGFLTTSAGRPGRAVLPGTHNVDHSSGFVLAKWPDRRRHICARQDPQMRHGRLERTDSACIDRAARCGGDDVEKPGRTFLGADADLRNGHFPRWVR